MSEAASDPVGTEEEWQGFSASEDEEEDPPREEKEDVALCPTTTEEEEEEGEDSCSEDEIPGRTEYERRSAMDRGNKEDD